MATASIMVRILGNTTSIDNALDGVQAKMDRVLEKTRGLTAASTACAAALAAAGAGLAAFGGACVKAAADMEQTQTAFANMLGSAKEAAGFVKDLQKFAAETPFEFNQVKGAAQKFLAFGFTAEQVIPTLTAVGDAASALGMRQDGIDRLTLALGQMAAKGKVSGEEMRQLAEAGIPAWQMLAESIGVSIPEAMDMVSRGTVDAQTGLEALVDGMNEKFAGMMELQSQTVAGLLSTIQDNIDQTMTAIGQSLVEAMNLKELLQEVGDFLNEFRETVQSSGIAEALRRCVPPELGAAFAALTGAVITLATFGFLPLAVAAAAALIPMLPYVAVGAAIGVAFYAIWRYANQLEKGFTELCSRFSVFGEWLAAVRALATSFQNELAKFGQVVRPLAKVIGVVLAGAFAVLGGVVMAQMLIMAKFSVVVMKTLSRIMDMFSWFYAKVSEVLQWVGDKFMWLVEAILPAWVSEGISLVGQFVDTAIGYLGSLLDKISEVGKALAGVSDQVGETDAAALFEHREQQRKKTGSSKVSYSQFGNTESGTSGKVGGGGGGAGRETDKLADAAARISASIGDEWARTFSTRVELVERWYAEETAELEKSRSANENYERDKQRLIELYGQKRIMAAQQEAEKMREIQQKIRNVWMNFNEATQLKGLTGAAGMFAEWETAQAKAADAIRDRWQKLSDDYIGMTAREQAAFRAALEERGMAYALDTQNRISFDELMHAELAANEADYLRQREDMLRQNKDIEAEIKAAFDELDMERLQATLDEENIMRMEQLEQQRQYMQEYQDAMLDAHFSTAELLSNIRKQGFDELEKSISGLLQGTTSWGQALQAVGKTLNKVISDYFAQWISGMIRQAVFGKQKHAEDIAMANATGPQVAAAWYPAAMNALIATGGAAGVQATAAYAAAMGAGAGMNAIQAGSQALFGGIKLAAGGIATGPTAAMVGEGKYPEAVLPLNEETFADLGEGIANSGGGQVTINVQAMDASSFEDWLGSSAGNVVKQFLLNESREFAAEGGTW